MTMKLMIRLKCHDKDNYDRGNRCMWGVIKNVFSGKN